MSSGGGLDLPVLTLLRTAELPELSVAGAGRVRAAGPPHSACLGVCGGAAGPALPLDSALRFLLWRLHQVMIPTKRLSPNVYLRMDECKSSVCAAVDLVGGWSGPVAAETVAGRAIVEAVLLELVV